MIFTEPELANILSIFDFHSSFLISTQIGNDALRLEDKQILNRFGVDWKQIGNKYPPYYRMYLWGRLSSALSNYQAAQVTYNDFKKYVERGQYLPLSKREQNELQVAKQITVGHIKLFQSRIKETASSEILREESKRIAEYERVFRKEIERGVVDRKSIQNIISEIGTNLNKWNYDWNRLVSTEMQSIYNRGRLMTLASDYGEDSFVWKQTYPLACQDCIRLHLKNGVGSEPILFKISDLIANGSNIGRKRADWKATIDPEHPHCRCDIQPYFKGQIWDMGKNSFVYSEKYEKVVERKSKIKITVGDKQFIV